jgi:hypothetical protein
MKVPKVLFVKHCPKINPERKEFLEKHLKARVPIEDVRWVEDYNHDHPFVEFVNKFLKLPYGCKLTSNMIKSLHMWKTMVDENIESAFLVDDDVLFNKNWLEVFECTPEISDLHFINLGTSFFVETVPDKLNEISNMGGCEAAWCDIEFAKGYLNNLNLCEASDLILFGYLYSIHHPVINLPICRQTSMLEAKTSLDHDTRKSKMHWSEFVQKYKHLPKISYSELLEKYETYAIKKQKIEEAFKVEYGVIVNVNRSEYICGEDKNIIHY